MISKKFSWSVIPAKAGLQNILKELDSGLKPAGTGFARNDEKIYFLTFRSSSILILERFAARNPSRPPFFKGRGDFPSVQKE